jgi:hypothetical protein
MDISPIKTQRDYRKVLKEIEDPGRGLGAGKCHRRLSVGRFSTVNCCETRPLDRFRLDSPQPIHRRRVELIEENGGGPGARLKQRLELIDENGGGPGVRLRKSGKEKAPQIVRSFGSAPCPPFDWANRLSFSHARHLRMSASVTIRLIGSIGDGSNPSAR